MRQRLCTKSLSRRRENGLWLKGSGELLRKNRLDVVLLKEVEKWQPEMLISFHSCGNAVFLQKIDTFLKVGSIR
jgi:hypothetical protein